MPKYKIELLNRRVERQLDRIHEPDFGRIVAALRGLADDPRPPGCKKLRGMDGWRIRVGDWRVIYHIDDQAQRITVAYIRRRRENTYR